MDNRTDPALPFGPRPILESRVLPLDILRGFAALLIFVYHYFALVPLPPESVNSSLRGIVLSFFGMGVPIFYALSGISLYIGFFRQRKNPDFAAAFYRSRFYRIAPLFYVAMAIWIGIFLSRGAHFEPIKAFTSASFLFNLVPGWHESYVAAGWSIGIEMLFYAFFPIVLMAAHNMLSALIFWIFCVLLSILGYAALVQLLPQQNYPNLAFVSHFGFFATGILIYFAVRRRSYGSLKAWRSIGTIVLLVILFVGSIYFLTAGYWTLFKLTIPQAVARMLWTIPIGLLLFICCLIPATGRFVRPLVLLGHWSYSLYLLHPIVLYFVFEPLRASLVVPAASSWRFASLFAFSLLLLIGLSFLSYEFIEQPLIRWGRHGSFRVRPIST